MSVCHYMRVWLPVGGVGGTRLAMPSARSTAAARGVGVVTERLVVPSPRSMSTTRMDLRTLSASVAERSRRADSELPWHWVLRPTVRRNKPESPLRPHNP